jgi:ABC-type transport system involved in multi-copper enzyme maturation permease subunit
MSWHGIRTVAALELRQRVRTSRWPIVLGLWFVTVGLVTLLAYLATNNPQLQSGQAMYDIVVFFVLGLAMLIVPSLTATSVNGDREHGVLATLQTTLLTPWEITVGKLLAAWAVALTFLATSLPFLAWAWFEGGLGVGRIALSLIVLILVLAVVCAIGLMFSSLTARTVSSAVLTYLTIGALVFGTTIGFGLSAFLVTHPEQQKVYGLSANWWSTHQPTAANPGGPVVPTVADCTQYTERRPVTHTERIWWMLPLNPFVVVADAAPSEPRAGSASSAGFTPLRWISAGARLARKGPDAVANECLSEVTATQPGGAPSDPIAGALKSAPVWPYGLTFLLLAGAGSVVVSARRLRTPLRRLPSGTRIA